MDTSFLETKRNFIAVVTIGGLLGAVGMAAVLGASPTELGIAVGGGLAVAGIVLGTYTMGRRYGHPHSHAVAWAAIAFGTLYLIAVTYRLLTEFGLRSTNEVGIALGAAIVGSVLVIGVTAALGRFGPSPN